MLCKEFQGNGDYELSPPKKNKNGNGALETTRPTKKTRKMKMKKLIVVMAAVAMACASQAATIKWGTGTVKVPGTTTNMTKSNISLYFWTENVSDPWTSKATASGEGDAVTYAISGGTGATATYKSGVATITGGTYDKGDTAYAAVILTYDANSDGKIGVGDYYMTGTGSYTLESDMNATPGLSMGSWTQIASTTPTPPGPGPVPEPTSGLLLLVGAGMLALRRKQK